MTLPRLMSSKLRRHRKEAIRIPVDVALQQCNDVSGRRHWRIQGRLLGQKPSAANLWCWNQCVTRIRARELTAVCACWTHWV